MIALIFSLIVAVASPAAVDLGKPIETWVHAFNTQQAAFPSDAFSEDCSVIDEFPPFQWSGPGGVRRWYAALVGSTDPKRRRAFLESRQHLTLSAPHDVEVSSGGAYVVYDATLTWRQRGVYHAQHGKFTVAERKTARGWRIAAHSWTIESVGSTKKATKK